MLAMSFRTKHDEKTIMDKARNYFADNVGLKTVEQNPCCITFKDNGVGYVTLTLNRLDKEIEAKVETREYEYQIKEFISQFK